MDIKARVIFPIIAQYQSSPFSTKYSARLDSNGAKEIRNCYKVKKQVGIGANYNVNAEPLSC